MEVWVDGGSNGEVGGLRVHNAGVGGWRVIMGR